MHQISYEVTRICHWHVLGLVFLGLTTPLQRLLFWIYLLRSVLRAIIDLDLVCLVWLFLLSLLLLLYVNTNQSCWRRRFHLPVLSKRACSRVRERERRVRKIHETIVKIRPSKSELSRNKIQRSRNNRNWSIERVEIICSGRGRLSWVTLTKV